MGSDKNYNGQGNIFSSAPKDAPLDATDSRLVSYNNSYRNALIARNLYTPNLMYPLPASESGKVINAIDSVLNVLTPFKSFDLNNTIFGRLVGEKTPLTTIGLALLGKQFAYNEMSHLAQQTFPIININNLFDGNKNTKLFSMPINYSITKKTAPTTFQDIIEKMSGSQAIYDSPFNSNSTSDDYLKNTGQGQQNVLLASLNRNLYKEKSDLLKNIGEINQNPMQPRSWFIEGGFSTYFNLSQNPYISLHIKSTSERSANDVMKSSYINTANYYNTQEYAPDKHYIDNVFGTPNKSVERPLSDVLKPVSTSTDRYINGWINNNIKYLSDDVGNQVIWGWDGVSESANDRLNVLRGLEAQQISDMPPDKNLSKDLNINNGLLKYTSELLNATDGNIVDITRKIFAKGDNVEGFNGSGIYAAPSWSMEDFATKVGIRQHSILDQYDRYAKAIRFKGNIEYKANKGNVNSVVHKTVLPRIHPTWDKDKNGKDFINNKNLMFSIENLAIRAVSKDNKYGIIDDDYGSTVPASEVGPFNGRLMWFPPYNIEVFETTAAKYESTVMVGRGEPMYNYQNSERSATLGFTLIIDYPPQLRDPRFRNTTEGHKYISEFFAFGMKDPKKDLGTPPPIIIPPIIIPPVPPIDLPTKQFYVFFPNDRPIVNNKENDIIIQKMYDEGYEVDQNCTSDISWKGQDGSTTGMNSGANSIYVKYPLLDDPDSSLPGHKGKMVNKSAGSQYSYDGDLSDLNVELKKYFNDEINRQYYAIDIIGAASELYLSGDQVAYNKSLGQRRADAVYKLVTDRITAIFDTTTGFEITPGTSIGSSQAPGTAGSTLIEINSDASKGARYAKIIIRKKSTPSEIKKEDITPEAQNRIAKDLAAQKKYDVTDNIFTERPTDNDSGKILNGFGSIERNYYIPAFHSQTPEEFHRRLVFLQQCMRQGNAQKRANGKDLSIKNSVFGRQPVCILRIADFFYTKVIIENLNIDYAEAPWDTNPEGFGMQPMIAKVTLQMKIIGGQSLVGPIDALQNAVSFNYYANSTFSDQGMYAKPFKEAVNQDQYINGVNGEVVRDEKGNITAGILLDERNNLNKKYEK